MSGRRVWEWDQTDPNKRKFGDSGRYARSCLQLARLGRLERGLGGESGGFVGAVQIVNLDRANNDQRERENRQCSREGRDGICFSFLPKGFWLFWFCCAAAGIVLGFAISIAAVGLSNRDCSDHNHDGNCDEP
jgi:hypothetical protein